VGDLDPGGRSREVDCQSKATGSIRGPSGFLSGSTRLQGLLVRVRSHGALGLPALRRCREYRTRPAFVGDPTASRPSETQTLSRPQTEGDSERRGRSRGGAPPRFRSRLFPSSRRPAAAPRRRSTRRRRPARGSPRFREPRAFGRGRRPATLPSSTEVARRRCALHLSAWQFADRERGPTPPGERLTLVVPRQVYQASEGEARGARIEPGTKESKKNVGEATVRG
jgi:hypothetical protein